jgi:hypothetical protein
MLIDLETVVKVEATSQQKYFFTKRDLHFSVDSNRYRDLW